MIKTTHGSAAEEKRLEELKQLHAAGMGSPPRYDIPFTPNKKPVEPSALQQAGSTVANSALGKIADAGWDKGATALKNWWGGLAMPPAGPGLAGKAAAGQGVITNAAPGVMAKLGAAAPMALPWMIGAGIVGKALKFWNKGGAVHANMGGLLNMDMGKFKGPLSGLLPQYKERGGYQEDEMSHRSKNMYKEWPAWQDYYKMAASNVWNTEAPMWEKLFMTGTIPVAHQMDRLKRKIGDWNSNAMNYVDPNVLQDYTFQGGYRPGSVHHMSMLHGPLSDERWIKDDKEFKPSYKNQGGEATSKPQSTKIEKKETIEYKS
tara:strand:+ start:3553 stop:4506 length:954 start_codon:yes stop_codon:yes gene_type:complete